MPSLIENYNEISKKIGQLNSQIDDFNQEIAALSAHRDEEIPARIENLKNQLKKIDEYKEKIAGFMHIAEQHMISKNLPSIEAPDGYRINLNRLRTWAMLIDPMSEDDVYAQKVYLVANCDQVFLDKKKEEFTARIAQLEEDYNVGAPEQIKALNQKIAAVQEKIREYLDSDELQSFADQVKRVNEANMYSFAPETFDNPSEGFGLFIPGSCGHLLDVIPSQRTVLKEKLGRFYDEKRSEVYLPMEGLPADEEFAMTVSCVPARKKLNEMDAGIRNLIFRMIDKSPAGSRKVVVIDAVRGNTALLGGLKGLEGTDVLEPMPRNYEQITQTLEGLVSNFTDLDDTLDQYDTVLEYNRAVEADKRLPRTLVILVGWPKDIKGENAEYVQKIFSNYERYGLSFIAINVSSGKDKEEFGLSDYVGENVINITMNMRETKVKVGQGAASSFSWYPFPYQLTSDYCKAVKDLSHGKGKKVTDYAARGLLEGGMTYTRGHKLLDLPYGVDSKDHLHSIVFENENFASFLMGASGSGKSTFLHSLITGIIKNYHPDDVELWLADFKMAEFSQYIDPMPPHVKYILLDESQELIYDLIDRLTEKLMERQRFFMKHKDLKKVEKVPSENFYMPVIFVILDEFSIMSQAINESQEYRLKLQNLLAKGRAMGIKFLFSSQTFTTGVTGLTATAKAQIQMRIAMKAAKTEIVETLELSAAQRTDQVQNWIDALPAYHALIKYWVKGENEDRVMVRRTMGLYFDDKDSPGDPYRKQRDLICEINSKMRPVSEYHPENLYEYLDKNPIVVDGNSYDMYDEDLLKRRIGERCAGADVSADETFVSFGRPRLMTDMRLVSVTQEARENFLLFAGINEQMCAASVLISLAKAFKMQGKKVQIWTYSRSRIFTAYEQAFSEAGVIVKDLPEICASIKEIRDNIRARKNGDDLIILLGMERICGDFAFVDGSEGSAVPGTTIPTTPSGLTAPLDTAPVPEAKPLTESEEDLRKKAQEWIRVKRQIKADNKDKTKEELDAIIAEEKEKFFAVPASDSTARLTTAVEEDSTMKADEQPANSEQPAETVPPAETAKPVATAYNALEDFQYILMQGSRFGYHFATYLSNCADLKVTGFKADWFRHRLSFQMSVEDSRQIFSSKIASTLPEHVCQYYDLLEGFSFRPYLNKGIDWDGWGVSEAGELISPNL